MRSLSLALTAFALFAAAPSAFAAEPAASPITNPTGLVDNATPEVASEIVTQLGAQQVEIKESNGQRGVSFTDGAIPYNIGFGLCNAKPGKCLAMLMIVIVNPGTTNYPLEALNSFNKESMYVTMAKLDDTRFAVGHVMIIDGGVTRSNIAINVASFILTFHEGMKHLQNQVVAGSYPNSRAMLSANRPAPLRFERASPQDIEKVTKALTARYQTSLRRFR